MIYYHQRDIQDNELDLFKFWETTDNVLEALHDKRHSYKYNERLITI